VALGEIRHGMIHVDLAHDVTAVSHAELRERGGIAIHTRLRQRLRLVGPAQTDEILRTRGLAAHVELASKV
jgi:hypothetical protein